MMKIIEKIMTRYCALFTVVLFVFFNSGAQDAAKIQMEKEGQTVDFSSIQKVLKNDKLEGNVLEKMEIIKQVQEERKKEVESRYKTPSVEDFWPFVSEYWLVKNAPLLKWNFEKPDYGITETFEQFLEKFGHFEKYFKILLLNTPTLPHFSLPSSSQAPILLLSVPFIRTLDLSQLEISILLYENFIRHEMGLFQKKVTDKKLDTFLKSPMLENGKLDEKLIKDLMKQYDEVIFAKGFSFQEQFEVTRKMGELFKSDMKLWNVYLNMLKKIDDLAKTNLLYKDYVKIYPSPEMQINWLIPEKKEI